MKKVWKLLPDLKTNVGKEEKMWKKRSVPGEKGKKSQNKTREWKRGGRGGNVKKKVRNWEKSVKSEQKASLCQSTCKSSTADCPLCTRQLFTWQQNTEKFCSLSVKCETGGRSRQGTVFWDLSAEKECKGYHPRESRIFSRCTQSQITRVSPLREGANFNSYLTRIPFVVWICLEQNSLSYGLLGPLHQTHETTPLQSGGEGAVRGRTITVPTWFHNCSAFSCAA